MIKTSDDNLELSMLKLLLSNKEIIHKMMSKNANIELFDNQIHRFMFNKLLNNYVEHNTLLKYEDLEYLAEANCKDDNEKLIQKALMDKAKSKMDKIVLDPERFEFLFSELTKLLSTRQIHSIVESNLNSLKSGKVDPSLIMKKMENDLFNSRKKVGDVKVEAVDLFSKESIESRIIEYDKEKGIIGPKGVPYPFPTLNAATGGMQETDLILFAARQKVGKSITMLNCAAHASLNGYSPLYVTIEQSSKQQAMRLDSFITKKKHLEIKMRKLGNEEEVDYKNKLMKMNEIGSHFYLIDAPKGCTISMIEKEIYRFLDKGKNVDLIVIDYLSLIRPDVAGEFMFNIGVMAQQLKEICRDIKIPIITASQMNRESEKTKDKSTAHLAFNDQIGSHIDYGFALVPIGENRLQIQTMAARDSEPVTVNCLTNYQHMIIMEEAQAIEQAKDLELEDF